MSVAFGSPLTSANTNASFMSRTQDTDTVGKVDVNNPTDSTAKTNGALHTTGGLGVEKKASVNELNVDTFTGQKALVSSSIKDVIESVTTDTELSYLSGVTSNVQTQIDSKANDASVVHLTGNETIGGEKTFSADAFFDQDVTIDGNLTVNGTTTTVNSATLDVTDQNITVNNNGNDATAEGAGLTVDRTGTSGSLIYENALASRWKAGDLGSESEVLTVGASQTITADKTFTAKLNANNELNLSETVDNTSTGSSATVPTTTPSVRLTNASLVSIANIDDVTQGKFVVLSNHTGNSITILNDSGGTAIKRILTGTGSNLTLEDNKSIILSYSSVESRWMVMGGTGTAFVSPLTTNGDIFVHNGTIDTRLPVGTNGFLLSADSSEATGLKWITAPTSYTYAQQQDLTLTASDQIAISLVANFQLINVQGNSGPVTLASQPFGASAPINGAEIMLVGEDNTNTVSIVYNDGSFGCVGNFSTIELARFQTARFMYNSFLSRWIYVS